MEKSGSAESALTYQMVNLNISNIMVQVHKAGSFFSGARLTDALAGVITDGPHFLNWKSAWFGKHTLDLRWTGKRQDQVNFIAQKWEP